MIRVLLIAGLLCTPMSMFACGLEDAARVSSDDGFTLFYRLKSPPLLTASHFSMQFRICRGDTGISVERFMLDASMPAHGHGTNYRPSAEAVGPGAWRVRGMLLHMPGEWELRFAVRDAGVTTRLAAPHTVR